MINLGWTVSFPSRHPHLNQGRNLRTSKLKLRVRKMVVMGKLLKMGKVTMTKTQMMMTMMMYKLP